MTDEQAERLIVALERIAVASERGDRSRNDLMFYGRDMNAIDPRNIAMMDPHVTWINWRDD